MNTNAERKPDIFHVDLDAQRTISAGMTMSDLMDKWLKYKKAFVKDSTYSNFMLVIENHIKPFLGDRKLGSITEGDMQDFIVHLYTEGRKDGKGGFGLKTIRDIMLPLKMALDYACKYNRSLVRIDWSLIEYPKDRKTDHVRAMTHEQQRRFVQAVYLNLNQKTASYLIALSTGMRIGEICGLQMQDISLSQCTISVGRTVYRIYDKQNHTTKLVVDTPKTESSVRTIPFPEMLAVVIERFYIQDRPEYYFVTGKRKPTDPRTLRQAFNRFLKRNNLPHMKFHELRHTYATRAVEIPEFDIKSLSAILGHKNPAFTLNVYGRADMGQEIECVKHMNKWL